MLNDIVVDLSEQGTEEWLKAKLGKFGASEAWKLMCRNKNGTYTSHRKDLITRIALERLTGETDAIFVTNLMREGTEREPIARFDYETFTNTEVEQTGFWHNDVYGASPDGLVGDKGGVEYKNRKPSVHIYTLKTKEIPETAYWQMIQALLVTKREWWDYDSYNPQFPPNAQRFIKRITRQEVLKDIEALESELLKANEEVEQEVELITNYKA